MSNEAEKSFWWLVLMLMAFAAMGILIAAFVSAVGAFGYFLTHGGAALFILVVGYFIWRGTRR